MSRTIVLKGYYGFRNFGDDLLFIVSWKWLRTSFPDAAIIVCTESRDPRYLEKLVSETQNFVRNQDSIQADLVFHGGGGTYFDFREGPFIFRLVNAGIRIIGPRLSRKMYNAIQVMRGRHRVQGILRAGVGLGVGSYTPSSKRYPFDSSELAEFDLLGVRDQESQEHLRRMGLSTGVMVASDLAFLTSHWMPNARPLPEPKKLGIVLRDWPYDHHAHHDAVEAAVRLLMSRGFTPMFFSFDPTDEVYKQRFSSLGTWLEWLPGTMTTGEFVRALGSCERMLSSRAHGVIVAGCLGIPCVSLEIEPKLKAVSALLPGGVRLIEAPLTAESIVDAVTTMPPSRTKEAVEAELQENARKVLAALDQVADLAVDFRRP